EVQKTICKVTTLNKIDYNEPQTQCLIIVPTRYPSPYVWLEQDCFNQGLDHFRFTVYTLQNSTFYHDDEQRIQKGPQIIIGTAGQVLYGPLGRQWMDITKLKIVIFYAGDQTIERGLRYQIEAIVKT